MAFTTCLFFTAVVFFLGGIVLGSDAGTFHAVYRYMLIFFKRLPKFWGIRRLAQRHEVQIAQLDFIQSSRIADGFGDAPV